MLKRIDMFWMGAALVFTLGCNSHLETFIAGPTEVTNDTKTLVFKEPLRAKYPATMVLLETRLSPAETPTPLDLAEQAGLELTLIQPNGTETPLRLSFINQYVSGGAAILTWPTTDPGSFSSLRLRATKSIKFERILWFSYDPRTTKSGLLLPEPRANAG